MTAAPDAPQQPEPFRRWNTYSSERFPPLQHGVLIAAFTSGMLSSTARPAPSYQTPTAVSDLVGSATAFLLTLQPRILDKFKNFEEEPPGGRTNRHHGIWVSMPTLRRLWFIVAALEVAGALLLDVYLVLVLGLLLIWGYSGLMGMKFFIAAGSSPTPSSSC